MAHSKAGTTTGSGLAGRVSALGRNTDDRRRIPRPDDRRLAPRIRLPKVQAEIASLGLPVTVLEVGFGGLSISSECEFSVGEVHELRCCTSPHHSVILRVEVRHCRPENASDESTRFITGFQFLESWSPGDHSAVDALIERIINVLSVDKDR